MDTPVALPSRLAPMLELEPPKPREERAYVEPLGLTAADVPALVELAQRWADPLHFERTADTREMWAPIHAWRALAELGEPVVVSTVLAMLDTLDDQEDQFYLEEFPGVCARIGPDAIPLLERYLHETAHHEYTRIATAHALEEVGQIDADARRRVVGVLAGALERRDADAPSFNAFLISYLTDLGAVEHAETIRQAFEAGVVSTLVCGDWPRIAYELGVGPPPPRRPSLLESMLAGIRSAPDSSSETRGLELHRGVAGKTDKAARKRQKQARKKNRRK